MPLTNTIFTEEMAKHPHHWQALLECIADYLREGPGVWWRKLKPTPLTVKAFVQQSDVNVPENEMIRVDPGKCDPPS